MKLKQIKLTTAKNTPS